MFKGERKEKKK